MIERPNMGDGGGGVAPLAWADREFQDDLKCALDSAVPVLITGPPAVADGIARRIHGAAWSRVSPVIIDPDTVRSPGAVHEAFAQARPDGKILLRNVERLSKTQQDALCHALDRAGVRVVATTGVNLFALVERGAFDAKLFYRLNQIHLVPPIG